MGFLAPAEAVILRAMAAAMAPSPPPDITRWCEDNILFDERSPLPGPFRIDRFPFLREVHEALSPEHPAREVTLRASAQIGKTVSVIQPTLGAWFAYVALDALVVHPTTASATEWVDNKWMPMRRQAPDLRAIFGLGRGDNNDAKFNQETVTKNGSLKVTSAGSPNDLAGTSRRLVILDDLSKFEPNDVGDPEMQALSRAAAFEDAKILRVSTPRVSGTCRISKAFARSDQRFYHVPCPHCAAMAPLTWENFRKSIDPERLHAAHFTCEACGSVIGHEHKEQMLKRGCWVAANPHGDHPGFHLWRAYAPQRDWASIAVEYAQVMGWTGVQMGGSTEAALAKVVEAETEQTFWNEVLGLPYEQASAGPDWQMLRDRVEHAPEGEVLPLGIVPAQGVILTAGVDCQLDRTEVHVVAFGRNYRRWAIDYRVIPHHIGSEECRAALNALLKATWKTERGLPLPLDMMAIDVGTYRDAVWDYGKTHPWNRVILVKGASTQNGPIMAPMQFERRKDGRALKSQKRAFLLNVSQMKGDFYAWLAKDDPLDRGYVSIAQGLGDEWFRQISSEVRVLKRSRSGVVTSSWELAEPSRRNEGLDTMNYAEAAARRKGWASMTDAEWAVLDGQRSAAPDDAQADLFDASLPVVPKVAPSGRATAAADRASGDAAGWIADRKDWI
jgi:phage terminase large subunit GpA-like protein